MGLAQPEPARTVQPMCVAVGVCLPLAAHRLRGLWGRPGKGGTAPRGCAAITFLSQHMRVRRKRYLKNTANPKRNHRPWGSGAFNVVSLRPKSTLHHAKQAFQSVTSEAVGLFGERFVGRGACNWGGPKSATSAKE